ncbi:MAG: nitroreductase family protein [Halobacteriota archaeon]
MKLKDLVSRTRSYRRFDEAHIIDYEILENLVGLARLSASGANRQPLKFLIYDAPEDCSRVFPSLVWAGYLKDWNGPEPGERPTGYIIILGDKTIAEEFAIDCGIAAQSMKLGATEAGLGGCMIASIRRELLRAELKIPDRFEILLILALGKPVEKVIVDDMVDGDVKYWRDKEKSHHVPKRPLSELIIKL